MRILKGGVNFLYEMIVLIRNVFRDPWVVFPGASYKLGRCCVGLLLQAVVC